MNNIRSWALAALLVLALPLVAKAEGFSIIDWSARGVALSGGLVARADDASAVGYNPAGITQLPGTRLMLGTTIVSPMGKVDTFSPVTRAWDTTSVVEKHWNMPHFYVTHQLTDKLWLGLGGFPRFGLGNGYSRDWPGATGLAPVNAGFVDVSLQTFTVNPTIAWKATDKLSLAVGLELTGAMMEMNNRVKAALPPAMGGPIDNMLTMDGMGGALSANIAMRYAFNEQWAVGLTYRSRMRINVHGEAAWDKQLGGVMRTSDLHGTLNLPDSIAAALMWKPTPRLSFEAGLVYTAWSNYKHLDIYLEEPVNTVQYGPKHWRDAWTFNGSVEYQALNWLALRAGFGIETSPANMDNVDYMVPANGRWYLSTGVGISWDNWTVDLGYSYMTLTDFSFDQASRYHASTLPGRGYNAYANIVSLSVGYAF